MLGGRKAGHDSGKHFGGLVCKQQLGLAAFLTADQVQSHLVDIKSLVEFELGD
jgi:hypothetical protein